MGSCKHLKLSQMNPDKVSLFQRPHNGMSLFFTFAVSSPLFSFFKKENYLSKYEEPYLMGLFPYEECLC